MHCPCGKLSHRKSEFNHLYTTAPVPLLPTRERWDREGFECYAFSYKPLIAEIARAVVRRCGIGGGVTREGSIEQMEPQRSTSKSSYVNMTLLPSFNVFELGV